MNNLEKIKQTFWLALPSLLGLLVALLMYQWQPMPSLLTIPLPWILLPLAAGLLFSGFSLSGYLLARRAQQQTQRQLQHLRTEQGRERQHFMERLDHEFKNQLTVIRAGISSLQETHLDSGLSDVGSSDVGSSDAGSSDVATLSIAAATQSTLLETISRQTMRLVRLTSDLRKIAEIELRPLDLTEVDLTELLTEIAELLTEDHTERELRLSLPHAPWPLPIIRGDRDLLFLAFYNLVDNARKFSQPGDTLEIRAREEEQAIIVEVADTGIGIDADELPHVWDELYRGKNGHTVAGSGLGLPLVRAIIERHHGTISLASRIAQGTNVTVQLPKENFPHP